MEQRLNGSDVTETPLREHLEILQFYTDIKNIELSLKDYLIETILGGENSVQGPLLKKVFDFFTYTQSWQ